LTSSGDLDDVECDKNQELADVDNLKALCPTIKLKVFTRTLGGVR